MLRKSRNQTPGSSLIYFIDRSISQSCEDTDLDGWYVF